MFVRNAWYVGAWGHELTDKPIARTLLNEPVVLFRDAEGRAAMLEDRCCHRGAPLSLGEVTPKGLMCGYHGLVFDCTGACVSVPGQTRIPERAKVKSYPVVEQDEFVWVWMGDPALADKSHIPSWDYNNDYKNWPHKHTMMPVKCNYVYLLENLMDLSHVGYVHTKTIGSGANENLKVRMKVDRTDTGLKFSRWMLDVKAAPTFAKAGGFTGNVDRWQEFEFIAPSSIRHYSGAIEAGSDQDKREGGVHIRLFHAITPETEESCMYFWCVANGHQTDNPAATESLFEQVRATFAEDVIFVETQQKRLENYDMDNLVDIESDTARITLNRAIDRRLAEENPTNVAAE
jgi:vanillate O-demethylase monooxygenase subunit